VILPAGVQDKRGNPNRRRAERLDVVELALDAFEIAAVNGAAVAGIVIAVGIVVGCVAVAKSIASIAVRATGLTFRPGTS